MGKKHQGKVRDFYVLNGKRVIITTDRISSFDRVLGCIPYKGQVLNQLTSFWLKKTKHITPNHLLSVPDPNVMVVKNCKPYPVEIIVRGFITGITITSLWYNYQKGQRTIYGIKFPKGLEKNQKLPQPVITPTTRGTGPSGHDEKITKKEIIKKGIVSKKVYLKMEQAALALFKKGTQICSKAGLILVDTKYEFGDFNGKLTLIDEVHTPDSSRFWLKKTYKKRIEKGFEPENFDKEFFRLWFVKKGYRGDGKAPQMPDSYRLKVSQRYQKLYQLITGEKFIKNSYPINSRIKKNVKGYLNES